MICWTLKFEFHSLSLIYIDCVEWTAIFHYAALMLEVVDNLWLVHCDNFFFSLQSFSYQFFFFPRSKLIDCVLCGIYNCIGTLLFYSFGIKMRTGSTVWVGLTKTVLALGYLVLISMGLREVTIGNGLEDLYLQTQREEIKPPIKANQATLGMKF